ncbi:MAG: hypothetical protein IJK58_01335 [Clostridia bacterium]|nr:hypothetical protein [Clostridia bacterium]
MKTENRSLLLGRPVEFFSHGVEEEWGYKVPQRDSFAVIRPKDEKEGEKYPLFVVFHSAGHDLYSAIWCMETEGNHDIYHTPEDSFALVLDCRGGAGDWWWGGLTPEGVDEEISDSERFGTEPRPVEKRCIATVLWTIENYAVDTERVYAVGNSMGGSGSLGVAGPRGDIFAAIKANVPAGVRHINERCVLNGERPDGFKIPDPPLIIDYSAQDDVWSGGHELLYEGMRARKYALIGFFGPFGHQNNNSEIAKVNDLIHSLDISTLRLHDPYPVFTDASTDDPIPWPDRRGSAASGQVNGFFRWRNVSDSADSFEIELRLLRPDEWQSRVTFPCSSVADVSVRRRQKFSLRPGERFFWEFGGREGEGIADAEGVPTVPRLEITAAPKILKLKK